VLVSVVNRFCYVDLKWYFVRQWLDILKKKQFQIKIFFRHINYIVVWLI